MTKATEFISFCLLLFMLAALTVLYKKKSDASWQTFGVFLVVLGLHLGVSICNGMWGPIFGAERDAYAFHLLGLEKINVPIPDGFEFPASIYIPGYYYSVFLKFLYIATTESWLISCLVSTLVYAVLCIAASALYKELTVAYPNNEHVRQHSLANLVIYIGMLPTALLLTSFTMREVYQMLLLTSIAFYTVKLRQGATLRHLVMLIGCMAAFSSLHTGTIIFNAAYLFLSLFILNRKFFTDSINYKTYKYIYLAMILSFLVVITLLVEYLIYPTFYAFIMGAVDAGQARAFYGASDITGGFLSINSYFVVSFLNYYIRPFPWEITSVLDIVTLLENLLRFFVFIQILRFRKHITTDVVLVLLAAIIMEALWALGTLNWGTAQRHHIVAWPLFVVGYFALLTRHLAHVQMVDSNKKMIAV